MTADRASAPRRAARGSTTARSVSRLVTSMAAAMLVLLPALAAAEAALVSSRGFAPPPGSQPPTRFSLGLEAALPLGQPPLPVQIAADPPADTVASSAGPASAAPRAADPLPLRLPAIGDLSAIGRAQAPTSSDQRASSWGGFGRWLKRHWWVPVLVGVAAGVVIADEGGDDDRFGEDD